MSRRRHYDGDGGGLEIFGGQDGNGGRCACLVIFLVLLLLFLND